MDISMLTVLLMVLVLAGLVGWLVIAGITPALHTPLMAVTNAISGIVVVAAMLVAGPELVPSEICLLVPCPAPQSMGLLQWVGLICGWLAVVLCAINIFGGFAVTQRMLGMFKPKAKS